MNNSESNKQAAGSHTPGPWHVGDKVGRAIYGADDSVVAMCDSMGEAVSDDANARRIVACVNYCDGADTNALELDAKTGRTASVVLPQLTENVIALESQRDQLATKVDDIELALLAENQKRQDVERERDQLRGALELMLERVPEPPEANCSCHRSPPCNDCIEYGGEREAFEFAKDVVAAANGDAA